MVNRLARTIVAILILPLAVALGCNNKTPTAPAPTPTPAPGPLPAPASVTARSLYPKIGPTGGIRVVISGGGFDAAARVTFGGEQASTAVNSSSVIFAQAPAHAPGVVDIVVSNPDGGTSRLAQGFTYAVYGLTLSPATVAPGGQLSVSWDSPAGYAYDWIALYKVGDPNTSEGWWEYTKGVASGTLTLTAPMEPGQYEFRYLLDDGYIDAARSSPVTVR